VNSVLSCSTLADDINPRDQGPRLTLRLRSSVSVHVRTIARSVHQDANSPRCRAKKSLRRKPYTLLP
jgi:hypothetical protein